MLLPKLVFVLIFEYLNYRDSLMFALTCHKIYAVFELDYIWKCKPLQHDILEIK